MNYKRLEIYVWWTCNQKCTYCMEYPNMEKYWNKKVSKYDILKKLIKYKKLWYNHVTFLWWEPFIQAVFFDALIIAKKLDYTILVTTNCTTLHIEKQANKYLPYIDELIISFQAIDKEKQKEISRSNAYVNWEWVFKNVNKYWKWTYFKANIVITNDNLDILLDLVKYLHIKNIKNISITYPDIAYNYYWKKFVLEKIAPKYTQCLNQIYNIIDFSKKNDINISIVDFPFCIFNKEKINTIIELSDDYNYEDRLKLDVNKYEIKHINLKSIETKKVFFNKIYMFFINLFKKETNNNFIKNLPRKRNHCSKCIKCKYKNICWGPSLHYKELYSLDEINPIKNYE